MKRDDSFRLTHDVYGKAIDALVGDQMIVNYFIHNNQLIISTYDRRSTRTTEEITDLPKSLR